MAYDDRFDDYVGVPRAAARARARAARPGRARSTCTSTTARRTTSRSLLDAIFGRDCFLNEIIWAYDYGGRSRRAAGRPSTTRSWSTCKDPERYLFDADAVEREPYMAPGLVGAGEGGARQAADRRLVAHDRADRPGREKTGYPTQKPEGVLRRIVARVLAPGRLVLDFFAGCGTTGAVGAELGPPLRRSSTRTPRRSRSMRARLAAP